MTRLLAVVFGMILAVDLAFTLSVVGRLVLFLLEVAPLRISMALAAMAALFLARFRERVPITIRSNGHERTVAR